MHQPAGGVVDEDQQRAAVGTVFKPEVIGPIDLDELTDAFPPMARLVDPTAPLLAIGPEPGLQHPDPQRLATDEDAVELTKLLGRQRRTKARVPRADQVQRLFLDGRRRAPVARLTTLLGDQRRGALLLIGLGQSLNLASLKAQQLRRRRRREPAAREIAKDLQPRELLVAHEMQRHPGGLHRGCDGG